MLFISLVVLLAVLGVVTANPSLRATAAAAVVDEHADLPHNAELGIRIGHHFHRPAARNASVTMTGKKFSTKNMKDLSVEQFYISRRRANGDCTGEVIDQRYYLKDECLFTGLDGVDERRRLAISGPQFTSVKYTCSTPAEGKVSFRKEVYGSFDGSSCNSLQNSYEMNGNQNKCRVDADLFPYRGATTQSALCGGDFNLDNDPHLNTPGLGAMYGPGEYCSGDMGMIRYQPFGVCRLFVDYQNSHHIAYDRVGEPDKDTRFYYIKMTSCSDDGMVKVLAFSDPACSRALYKTHFNLNTDPTFESCGYSEEVGMWGEMFCVSGFPFL